MLSFFCKITLRLLACYSFGIFRREVGLRKFLPKSVIDSIRTKDLRRHIAKEFKSIASFSEEHCVFKFFEILKGITQFDHEIFKCALGVRYVSLKV